MSEQLQDTQIQPQKEDQGPGTPEKVPLRRRLRRGLDSLFKINRETLIGEGENARLETSKRFGRLNAAIIILGLLIGGGAAALTYFVFPAAVATLAALFGLAGPLALIVPLLMVGLVAAFYGMEVLAFLERGIFRRDQNNQRFMLNLVRLSVVVAGIGLGVFIAAATPAVFNLLTIPGLTGTAGVAVPLIIAGSITLVLTIIIAYGLYRASGMHLTQADIRAAMPAAKEIPSGPWAELHSTRLPALDTVPKGIAIQLQQAQELCLSVGREQKAPDYAEAAKVFAEVLQSRACNENARLGAAVQFQLDVATLCDRNKDSKDMHQLVLVKLAEGLRGYEPQADVGGYGKNALNLCIRLALLHDPRAMEERKEEPAPTLEKKDAKVSMPKATEVNKQYTKLFDSILKGDKDKALAAVAELSPEVKAQLGHEAAAAKAEADKGSIMSRIRRRGGDTNAVEVEHKAGEGAGSQHGSVFATKVEPDKGKGKDKPTARGHDKGPSR